MTIELYAEQLRAAWWAINRFFFLAYLGYKCKQYFDIFVALLIETYIYVLAHSASLTPLLVVIVVTHSGTEVKSLVRWVNSGMIWTCETGPRAVIKAKQSYQVNRLCDTFVPPCAFAVSPAGNTKLENVVLCASPTADLNKNIAVTHVSTWHPVNCVAGVTCWIHFASGWLRHKDANADKSLIGWTDPVTQWPRHAT